MSSLAVTLYLFLGAAVWLAYVVIKRARRRPERAGPQVRRHPHGLARALEVAGERLVVKGTQEISSLASWHVTVSGPFPKGLVVEPCRQGDEQEGALVVGPWRVAGPPELIARRFGPQVRAALAAVTSRFSLREGRLVATLEVRKPSGLVDVPEDALALAQVVLEARAERRLGDAMSDPDAALRALALDALLAAERGSEACRMALETAASDDDARVRMRVWIARGDIQRARAELEAAARPPDGEALQPRLHNLLRARVAPELLAPMWREACEARWATSALKAWIAAAIGNAVSDVVAALGGAVAAEAVLCRFLTLDYEVAVAACAALEKVGSAACVPALQAQRGRFAILARDALLRIQSRLGSGGELALFDGAGAGSLSEVEPGADPRR